VEIRCLKAVVKSGNRRYPLFVGFLPAEDIAEVAEAPSFRASQPHEELASNVLRPPVKDWQRPLDMDRVATIRTAFNDQGALMPNPVLLSANGDPDDRPQIRQDTLNGETPTGAWIVTVEEGRAEGSKPLWILDGQHRINGLAASAQRADEIPVVLLLNDDAGESYRGSDFASLFAQVTTTAKKLDELHNAWLTFAYRLDEYADDLPANAEHRAAMATVCEMCERAKLWNDEPNPFHNAIRFNPERPASQATFAYGCRDLKELVRKHYFADTEGPLEPEDLADCLGSAVRALRTVVQAPQERSVFFGRPEYAQVAMQDAFLIGVLAFVKESGVPADWEAVLKGLQFHTTDWKFHAWVSTLGGKAGTDSRIVAQRVLVTAFKENRLPTTEGDDQNLADYLRGNRAQVRLHMSRTNAEGRPLPAGRQSITLLRGEDASREVGEHLHVRIDPSWRRTNIARLDVIDATSNVANPTKITELASASGLRLDPKAEDRELQVAVNMIFYGGRSSDAKLTIRW
jgi:DGQHR domain-containing protein